MAKAKVVPLYFVPERGRLPQKLTAAQRKWARAQEFSGQRGRLLALPGADGGLAGYLFGTGAEAGRPAFVAGLAGAALPAGRYRAEGEVGDPTLAALAFRLGAYRFDRYRAARERPELVEPAGADVAEVERLAEAAELARDLINTPASDLGPEALDQAIRAFAAARKMKLRAIVGEELLKQNFPMIHA
ncbi:MAG TPA: leucyl aminopeptidase family protein, partial [Devosia sp.]|nr:leucyl aminopeptidase family protein [Devosia sp.]